MSDSTPILVVEDDPQVRRTIQWTLEAEGFTVALAEDGRAALDWAQQRRPALLVLDIGLRLVDGYGVAAGVRATHGESVPILVVTADGRAAEKAERTGAFAYLNKPFDLDELVALVRRGLREA